MYLEYNFLCPLTLKPGTGFQGQEHLDQLLILLMGSWLTLGPLSYKSVVLNLLRLQPFNTSCCGDSQT